VWIRVNGNGDNGAPIVVKPKLVLMQTLSKYIARLLYLGFRTTAQPELAGMYSCIANLRKIFTRSWHAFSGSLSRASLAASGLSENSVGTGPDTASPSNRQHERGHSSISTVGTLSLHTGRVVGYCVMSRVLYVSKRTGWLPCFFFERAKENGRISITVLAKSTR
jgi:hypothetical protein